ncbi:MAG: hypothetical protein ACR2PA_02695 [Hyphomicrobiaceae bacterium]
MTIEECIGFLSDPSSYPYNTGPIDVRETSKSWIFMTTTEVYKLKKRVKNHFQDLSTLTARKANSHAEVSLNRRLAPDVYLGTVPLTCDHNGAFTLDGEGIIVDWLVRMRRLPEDRMLNQIIMRGDHSEPPTRQLLARLVESLVDFYRRVPRARLEAHDYVAHFAHEQSKNRIILTDRRFPLEGRRLLRLLSAFEEALSFYREALVQRVYDGKVIQGHGDLRPEHVCLVEPPVVIDCLEFSERLRSVDPFDEVVFLGLECELLGANWIKPHFIHGIETGLGEKPREAVLLIYEAYRGLLRARQCLAHLLLPEPREPTKWLPKARQYLSISEQALATLAKQGG